MYKLSKLSSKCQQVFITLINGHIVKWTITQIFHKLHKHMGLKEVWMNQQMTDA